ncbi:phosphodiester glycosidase family protein [Pedobacter sp. MC2016-05]|uniref:phosphodiester glycosidase family protein n=1 Tax=Pedobacter sp. MC2016-05 TaxID=2994474 RepID=UPI002245ABE4|nr:phosphodiester glycosidase family protein [Pedobacter sp. MC2016-05]MCX2472966.1 phosphodiester glycosidase family protein [Pedobacter sp. MC2016-05]
MLKKLFSLILITSIAFFTYAQNVDSATVVKTKWQRTRVAKQVRLFRHHFDQKNLFAANENISFLEIKNTGRKAVFALGAEERELITTSNFGIRDTAIAAVNGNFFDVKNGGSVDFVKVKGNIINTNRLDKEGNRARHQQAAVVIDNGKISIKKWDGTADWETKLMEQNIMLNGPLLTYNDVDELLDTTSFTRLRHPRTCLGVKPNGRIILLTVDGRNEKSAGMSLHELGKLMKWLGCESAINFDGGGSTTLWVAGMPDSGVINYPTDNKKWDHEGQRKVANVVLVKKK